MGLRIAGIRRSGATVTVERLEKGFLVTSGFGDDRAFCGDMGKVAPKIEQFFAEIDERCALEEEEERENRAVALGMGHSMATIARAGQKQEELMRRAVRGAPPKRRKK